MTMETTEAMEALERAGRGAEAREIVEKAASDAQATYRAIQEDETRTEDYKRDEAQRYYDTNSEALRARLGSMAETERRAEHRDVAKVFGTEGLPGDVASLIISRRDAADRVAALETRAERRELLARATRAGDEVLARAVAENALDKSDTDTLNAFLADRPHLDEAAQRLWDAHRRKLNSQGKFGHTMLLAAMRPTGMSGLVAKR